LLELGLKTLLAYLLGAVLGSLVMGRHPRVDIREQGSGNAGGTNAVRTVPRAGNSRRASSVIDVGKALLAGRVVLGVALRSSASDPAVDRRVAHRRLRADGRGGSGTSTRVVRVRGGKGAATLIRGGGRDRASALVPVSGCGWPP